MRRKKISDEKKLKKAIKRAKSQAAFFLGVGILGFSVFTICLCGGYSDRLAAYGFLAGFFGIGISLGLYAYAFSLIPTNGSSKPSDGWF